VKKVINSFIVIGLAVLVLSVCSCFGKSKKLTKENLPTLVGRYSELCVVNSGGYNSRPVVERIALEIKEDGTYCFTIIDGKKRGIRSRGTVSVEEIAKDSFLPIHKISTTSADEIRNLLFEKAFFCQLNPEGLGIQYEWNPDKGIFDSEMMTDNFWDPPASAKKMIQLDMPLEFVLVSDGSSDSSVVKINRNRGDFLLQKNNRDIDSEWKIRSLERSGLRGL